MKKKLRRQHGDEIIIRPEGTDGWELYLVVKAGDKVILRPEGGLELCSRRYYSGTDKTKGIAVWSRISRQRKRKR